MWSFVWEIHSFSPGTRPVYKKQLLMSALNQVLALKPCAPVSNSEFLLEKKFHSLHTFPSSSIYLNSNQLLRPVYILDPSRDQVPESLFYTDWQEDSSKMLRLAQRNQSRAVAQAALRSRLATHTTPSVAAFHTSRWTLNEKKSEEKGQQQQQQQTNQDPSKTPFQVFVDTFRTEWKKSDELQNNIKALADETGKMAESGAYKKAKEAYDKAKDGTSTASSATGETLRKAGQVVGSAAGAAWDSSLVKGTRKVVSKTADTVEKATEPIRKTKFYQDVKEVIDDGSSMRYGGYEDKAKRRQRRELEEKKRLEEELKSGIKRRPVKENAEAGQNIVLHDNPEVKESWKESWENWKLNSSAGRKLNDLHNAYEDSENGFVSFFRNIHEKVGSFFEETETARVIRMFKELDPSFRQDEFLKDVRNYIIPEVLDAYVKGDEATLKMWLSEAPYNIWATNAKQYKEANLYSAGRIIDIRGVDILSAKLLQPSEVPVYVIGCRAQEIHMYKSLKTDEIMAGTEDHIQLSTYAMVLTRIPEKIDDEETQGWQVLELVRAGTRDWT